MPRMDDQEVDVRAMLAAEAQDWSEDEDDLPMWRLVWLWLRLRVLRLFS